MDTQATTKDTPQTLKQASIRYDIPLRTLYEWIKTGRLESQKLGRKHYVTERNIFRDQVAQ